MQCTSCNGIIVKEHFYDMVDDNGVLSLGAWRWASLCLRCGNVVEDRGIPLPLIGIGVHNVLK